MKTLKNYLKTIPLAFVLLTACSKDDDSLTTKTSIYAVGVTTYSDIENTVATLWKDGTPLLLTDKTIYSEASDIFVSGTDVYVGGNISGSEKSKAVIWKNGNPTYLTDGTYGTAIEAIHVSGSNVYAVGTEWNSTLNKRVSKLWKNGEETTIGDNFVARDLFVYNSDVYIVGNNGSKSLLWKNGTITELTDGSNDSSPVSVYVNNTDVYVVGYENKKATLWKNGNPTYLTDGINSAAARGVYVDGSDVYVVGNIKHSDSNYIATLWKNGVATELTNGIEQAMAFDIAVQNNNTYITGFAFKDNKPHAKLWKNEQETTLGDENSFTIARKIVVK